MTAIGRRGMIAGGAAAALLSGTVSAGRRASGFAPLLGDYGTEASILTLYEQDGALHGDGHGLARARLTIAGDTLAAPDGRRIGVERGGAALVLGGVRLPRHDFGAEVEARIRAAVRADPVDLRRRALAAAPPVETRPAASDLVPLTGRGLRLDIRYATANNFMGIALYERPGAFLQRPAAEALGRVLARLRARGMGLVIHDAYRPWFVTWMFWEATPAAYHGFVANPANGSRHNRGCAVDLSLTDLASGRALPMPSRYDEFSRRAHPDFFGGTSEERRNRATLRSAMEAEGFAVYAQEWWHFDFHRWADYPIGNATFTELRARR